jgi:hypothetical protein
VDDRCLTPFGLLGKRFSRRRRDTEKNVDESGTLFVSDRSGQGEGSMENLGPIRSPKAIVSLRDWATSSDLTLFVPLWLREIIRPGAKE